MCSAVAQPVYEELLGFPLHLLLGFHSYPACKLLLLLNDCYQQQLLDRSNV